MIDEVSDAHDDRRCIGCRGGHARRAARASTTELLGKKGVARGVQDAARVAGDVDERKSAGPGASTTRSRRCADALDGSPCASSAPRRASTRGSRPSASTSPRSRPRRARGHPHLVDAGVGAARGRVRRPRLPDRRGSGGRDRLLQLRGAEHAAEPPGAQRLRHAVHRLPRRRHGPAAHPHLAGADPGDADASSRRSTW